MRTCADMLCCQWLQMLLNNQIVTLPPVMLSKHCSQSRKTHTHCLKQASRMEGEGRGREGQEGTGGGRRKRGGGEGREEERGKEGGRGGWRRGEGSRRGRGEGRGREEGGEGRGREGTGGKEGGHTVFAARKGADYQGSMVNILEQQETSKHNQDSSNSVAARIQHNARTEDTVKALTTYNRLGTSI